jgi:hypothetical protein
MATPFTGGDRSTGTAGTAETAREIELDSRQAVEGSRSEPAFVHETASWSVVPALVNRSVLRRIDAGG